MDLLKFREYVKFGSQHGQRVIYDSNNKMWRKLEPEELVRQCLYQFLHREKRIPEHFMKIEYGFDFIGNKYRADIAIFNKSGRVLALAECKSFKLSLQQKHMDQLALYNQKIHAPYLILSNGISSMVFHHKDLNKHLKLDEFPTYPTLIEA